MKVFILQGLPGSGKSTYARKLVETAASANGGTCSDVVASADDYFTRNGVYQFEPAKLPAAHAYCLQEYTDAVRDESFRADGNYIFVDNTNTTVAEVAPYYALAQAYGWDVEILYFPCDPETAAQRNTHGVSLDTCKAMAARLEKFEEQMPPWWVRRVVE